MEPGMGGEELLRPRLVGDSIEVPLVDGSWRPYVNMDYAASAPPLEEVAQAMDQFMPYYSSVHRGAGFKSQISTAVYEGAREAVSSFFAARPDDTVVFTRNTTDSINLLAESMAPDTAIVAFATEHHANLLPWQKGRHRVTYLPPPASADEALERLGDHLRATPTDLVAVTGASNVTGELWPVAGLSRLAHANGARILLDAAQLAPHYPVSVTDLDVDYLAVSGHKMYAPYGAGVLIGRPDWLARSDPYMRGGGAVDFVTTSEVLWTSLPDRQEAGSPNVVGAAALGKAVQVLQRFGMEKVAEDELALAEYARSGLGQIPGVDVYRLWDAAAPRIGVLPFNVAGYHYSQVAAVLSAEYGIGVRHGCFCAHPLMVHVLEVDSGDILRIRASFRQGKRPEVPGAVRASFGLGSTRKEVDYLLASVADLARNGPKWHYTEDPRNGEYSPSPDPRPWPSLALSTNRDRTGAAESS
ncbi:MAG: aminotransferase class V-fold PLP-dependent enzyme [Candidatus Dormibacteria bacterium]